MDSEKKPIGVINLAPTWLEAVGVLLAVMENGTEEGKRLARAEFRRMAKLTDALIAERGHSGPVKVKQS